MITKINEAKALTKHVSCDCNCKLDGKRSGNSRPKLHATF